MAESELKDEDNNDEQMYAALTFAFILLVVGMPLWWHTTQVYRVALPYDEMDALNPQKVPRLLFPVHVAAINPNKSKDIVKEINEYFKKSELFNIKADTAFVRGNIIMECKTLEDLEDRIGGDLIGAVQLVEVPKRLATAHVVFGQSNTIFFSEIVDGSTLVDVLEEKILQQDDLSTKLLSTRTLRTPSSKHFAAEDAYDILITVLHPSPGSVTVEFDVVKAINDYMKPFADQLGDLFKLHIKSQWLYLVDLRPDPPPKPSEDGEYHILSESALPHVITPLEKKLGSHVSARRVINLVVWIPPCELSPLHIHTSSGRKIERDAFISPRWGAIQIVNPERKGSCDITVDGEQVMQVFIQQLRVLLGLPSSPSLGKYVTEWSAPVRQWEKEVLMRRRTLELLSSAKHTLKSLSELLGKINNIVINDEVGDGIARALANVDASELAIETGYPVEAHGYALKAHLAAEKAFTAPSLLALLYFPEDQKYAVYIPLFLPVMIPVLISLKPMREWFMAKWAKRRITLW